MATRCDDKYIKNDETFSFDKFLTTSNILKLCIMVFEVIGLICWGTSECNKNKEKEIQRVPFRKEDVYLTIGLLDLTFTCFFLFFSVYRCSWINRDIAYRIIDFCYSALASYAMNLSSTLIVALEDCDGMKAASIFGYFVSVTHSMNVILLYVQR